MPHLPAKRVQRGWKSSVVSGGSPWICESSADPTLLAHALLCTYTVASPARSRPIPCITLYSVHHSPIDGLRLAMDEQTKRMCGRAPSTHKLLSDLFS